MYHIRGGGGGGAVDIVGCSRVYHRRVVVVVGHRQDSIVGLRLKRKKILLDTTFFSYLLQILLTMRSYDGSKMAKLLCASR